MIEKMSEDERREVIKELHEAGYIAGDRQKSSFLPRSEFDDTGLYYYDVSKYIFGIADEVTNNFTEKEVKDTGTYHRYKNKAVSFEKSADYEAICKSIMEVIKKYARKQNGKGK